MRIHAKALIFSFIAAFIFSSCNNFLHDLIPPSGNEITSFRLKDLNGSDVTESCETNGTEILVKVSPDADISALIPSIEASEKSSVIPMTVNYIHSAAPSVNLLNFAVQMQNARQDENLAAWALDFAQKTPDFKVPELELSIDFNATIPFVVIAGTGDTRVYMVTVEHEPAVDEFGEPISDQSEKEILSFTVDGQDGESEITSDEVHFAMPSGSDIHNIIPVVEVSKGATVLPLTMDYVLKYATFSELLSMYSGYSTASDPEQYIAQWLRKNNITFSDTLDTPIDFSDSVYFMVRGVDSSVKLHKVTCTVVEAEDNTPRLNSLVFTKFYNEALVNDSKAHISDEGKSIAANTVYPAEWISDNSWKTDAFHLVPSISIKGDRVTFIFDGDEEETEIISESTPIPFTKDKKECVIKVYKGDISSEYTISIQRSEDPDTIRSVTDFRFPRSLNDSIHATAMASVVDDGDFGTITVTVMYTGTEAPASLIPTFITPGTLQTETGSTVSRGYTNLDLSTPTQKLICVSRNGMYRRTYTLKVNFIQLQSAVAAMRYFSFPSILNPALSTDAVGIINDSTGTIMVNALYHTAERPEKLIADFQATGYVTVDGILQSPGYSSDGFQYARNYTVTATDDPETKKTYRVQVAFKQDNSSACSLDQMEFLMEDNPQLSEDVTVTLAQNALKGKASLPYGTGSKTTPLIARFIAKGSVSVNGERQTSGVSQQNFGEDVVYTVTSADGTKTKDYIITLTETGSIIYIDCDATGRNDGSSWENAYADPGEAGLALKNLPEGASVEVWVANVGRNYGYDKYGNYRWYILGLDCKKISLTVRSGFSGTESSPSERQYADTRFEESKSLFMGIDRAINLDSLTFDGGGVWFWSNYEFVVDGELTVINMAWVRPCKNIHVGGLTLDSALLCPEVVCISDGGEAKITNCYQDGNRVGFLDLDGNNIKVTVDNCGVKEDEKQGEQLNFFDLFLEENFSGNVTVTNSHIRTYARGEDIPCGAKMEISDSWITQGGEIDCKYLNVRNSVFKSLVSWAYITEAADTVILSGCTFCGSGRFKANNFQILDSTVASSCTGMNITALTSLTIKNMKNEDPSIRFNLRVKSDGEALISGLGQEGAEQKFILNLEKSTSIFRLNNEKIAALYCDDCEVELKDCNFVGYPPNDDGFVSNATLALSHSNSFVTATNCTIGGTIYTRGILFLKNCTTRRIDERDEACTVAEGCQIFGRIDTDRDYTGMSSEYKNCRFTGENAIVCSSFRGLMQNCVFDGVYTTPRIQYVSDGTFDGCSFEPEEGSTLKGITVYPGATFKNMIFHGFSNSEGGAIDVYENSSYNDRTTTIENCVFVGNSATETDHAGGAVLIRGGHAVIKDCTFAGNTTKGSGGGLGLFPKINNREYTIDGCTFVNNICTDGRSGSDAYAGHFTSQSPVSGTKITITNTKVAASNSTQVQSKFAKDSEMTFTGFPTADPSLVSRTPESFLP